MTHEELDAMIKQQEEYKLTLLVLTMPVPKSWGRINTPMRVWSPFGLCRWYPSSDPHKLILYVELHKAKNYLKKVGYYDATK